MLFYISICIYFTFMNPGIDIILKIAELKYITESILDL